jgi:CRISPR-associated endonuclease/helicase Cas3
VPAVLTAEHFPAFHRWVHDRDPLPWQAELVSRLLSGEGWPERIEVPAGAGRRLLTDVVVFVTAAQRRAPGPSTARTPGARRILLVTDLPLAVDAAWEHARRLGRRLELARRDGTAGVAAQVVNGLLPAVPERTFGRPLTVTRMHAGPTHGGSWLDRPDRVCLVFATLDQVGSRLLFRGYGIGDERRPIEAAGVGTDSLWLLEDVADAGIVAATVAATATRDRTSLPLRPPIVVTLHGCGRDAPAGIVAPDHVPTAQIDLVPTAQIDQALADHAIRLARPPSSIVALICNTDRRARAVHRLLVAARSAGDGPTVDTWLLTGRARPIDLEPVAAAVRGRFRPGREHPPGGRPAVLVTTRVVEIGAELSADAVVTESAPEQVLRLRLAALDRAAVARGGTRASTGRAVVDGTGRAVVVGDGSDPGLAQCANESAPAGTPVLLIPTLDSWVSTSPVPVPDPAVAPFLHGFDAGPADVTVAWRDALLTADGTPLPPPTVDLALQVLPVQPEEQVPVPLESLREWLSGPDTRDDGDPGRSPDERARPVLVLRSPGHGYRPRWRWILPGRVGAGEIVVVPTEYGGLDEHGWNPRSARPVADVAELAALRRRRPALRLDGGSARRLRITGARAAALAELIAHLQDAARAGEPPEADPGETGETAAVVRQVLQGSGGSRFAEPRPRRGHRPDEWDGGWSPARRAALLGWLASGPELVWAGPDAAGNDPLLFLAGGGHPPEPAGPVTLAAHHEAVAALAGQIATELGLPPHVSRTITDAARWHDLGVAQPRFQARLRALDPWAGLTAGEPLSADEPLSAVHAPGAAAFPDSAAFPSAAGDVTDEPPGFRHEAWSAWLVRAWLNDRPTPYPGDGDLLVHLVAAHHGYARPWLPPAVDGSAPAVRADLDGAEVTVRTTTSVLLDHPGRFACLNTRYGRWGLALLEAVLRCADETVRNPRP